MGDALKAITNLVVGRTDERPTEYEWVARRLVEKGRILDVGCFDSILPHVLSFLGYEVWGVDIQPCITEGKWTFVEEDIRRTTLPSEFFDQILAVSTIEHVGMNCYGNTWIDVEHGDRMAVLEMYRILKQGGTMLITLPFGASRGDYWIRYYKTGSLRSLLEGLKWRASYARKELEKWVVCEAEEASQMPSGEGGLPQAIVCVVVER